MVPHGMAVALTAAAAFRFTFDADPERHLTAAALLDPSDTGSDADVLPGVITSLMADLGLPNGLSAIGYTAADVPDLVPGATAQQRLLATAPKPVNDADLAAILTDSLTLW